MPSLTGHWGGLKQGISLDIVLAENTDTITGAGSIVGTSGFLPATVTGVHVEPNITLTLAFPAPYIPTVFTGAFNGPRTLVGRLDGSGFVSFTYTLSLVDSTAVR